MSDTQKLLEGLKGYTYWIIGLFILVFVLEIYKNNRRNQNDTRSEEYKDRAVLKEPSYLGYYDIVELFSISTDLSKNKFFDAFDRKRINIGDYNRDMTVILLYDRDILAEDAVRICKHYGVKFDMIAYCNRDEDLEFVGVDI